MGIFSEKRQRQKLVPIQFPDTRVYTFSGKVVNTKSTATTTTTGAGTATTTVSTTSSLCPL